MAEDLRYHGWTGAEEYKQGEKAFRFLNKAMKDYSNIRVGILWPDLETHKLIKVTGPLTRVYREDSGIPYADLAYLEYGEDLDIKSWFSESSDRNMSLGEEMAHKLNLASLASEAETALGNIPEGIYAEGPATFSLGHFAIISFSFTT